MMNLWQTSWYPHWLLPAHHSCTLSATKQQTTHEYLNKLSIPKVIKQYKLESFAGENLPEWDPIYNTQQVFVKGWC